MEQRKTLLQRLFHIYPDERRRALLFAFLGFIWAFGATCALKFADALFLLHVGAESLPKAYTLIACGMFAIACILLYAFHNFSSTKIFLSALRIGFVFYVFIFVYMFAKGGSEPPWFWYSLKLIGFYLFAVLMTSYWTFIDQYHHLQDAKRLYCLFSSAIFLGAASTGLLMRSALLDLSALVLLILALFVLTYFSVRKIASAIRPVAHEEAEHEKQVYESSNYVKYFIRSVVRSPFTLLLMTSNLLIYLLLVITEYNYMYTFEAHFAGESNATAGEGTEADLTQFLGQWLATVSVSNLIFGLFIYSRVLRRFGIGSMLLITPLLLIIAFTGWSLSTSLLFPLIGFFVVEGTLYVIDDNNFNLLLGAVPAKLKYKIRVIIESFFEPVGTLLGALLLSSFQSSSKLLGLILAAFALVVAFALSANYLKALFSNLSENAVHFQRSVKEWLSRMSDKQRKIAEHRLLNLFMLGDEKAQLFACEGLLAIEDLRLLMRLLDTPSYIKTGARMGVIDLLEQSPFATNPLVLDALQEWLHGDFDAALQSRIYLYLARHGLLHPEKIMDELESDNLFLKGAAILALKSSLAPLPPSIAAQNRALAAQHMKDLLESDKNDEVCMGLSILGVDGEFADVDLLIPYLSHPSIEVARAAAKALSQAGAIDPIHHAPLMIDALEEVADNEVRLFCLKALKGVDDSSLVDDLIEVSLHFRPNERRVVEEIITNMGLRTVPALLSLLCASDMHDKCRLLAGRILGRLALPQLRANLSDIVKEKIEKAYFYFYHFHSLSQIKSHVDVTMLKRVLLSNYHSTLDFVIQVLGVAGEVEDEELLSRSLRSANPKVRSQVVETLERTCEPQIFRLLQPLVDDIPVEEKLRASGNHPMHLNALLDTLAESPAKVDQIIVIAMRRILGLPHWQEALRQRMGKKDLVFDHFAYELLES